jgi:uroporphyrinogen decarboxylase
MRQAGRYLPEYKQVRGDRDILLSIREPEEVVEITLQPLRRMPLDAAILFSDIVVPLAAIGLPLRVEQGRGPVLDDPIRGAADLARLRPLEPEVDEPYTLEAVRLLTGELEVPLIGFAGAPFTLASYLVEGGPSRDHARTKALMLGEPSTWARLMDALVDIVVPHLRAQVGAGASALQVFDSWVGSLAPEDYAVSVQPHMRRLFEGVADLGVPVIHFGVVTGELLALMRDAGGDVIGIDHRVPLDAGWERVGPERGVQGNLDPAALLAPWEAVERKALDVLARAAGRDGHVFNLGHGVLPPTPVGTLQRLVDLVHERTERT